MNATIMGPYCSPVFTEWVVLQFNWMMIEWDKKGLLVRKHCRLMQR